MDKEQLAQLIAHELLLTGILREIHKDDHEARFDFLNGLERYAWSAASQLPTLNEGLPPDLAKLTHETVRSIISRSR